MTRRNIDNSTDSLELLLDTICNTFGAVIFISMLVAILVSNSSTTPSPAADTTNTASDVAIVQAEIQEAQERLRVISGQVRQQKLVKSRLATEESMALAGKLQQQTRERISLMQQKSEAVKKVVDTKGAAAVLQAALSKQQSDLDTAQTTKQTISSHIRQAASESARTARIPRVRKTQKTPIVYAVDDGRLYQVVTRFGTINTKDCEKTTQHGRETIRPLAAAGVPVTATQSATLSKYFNDASAQTNFVQLFVSRDSFEAFLPVKDVLISLKLENEVIVTADDTVELMRYRRSESG